MAAASVNASSRFIAIASLAWCKMTAVDPHGIEVLLPADISDAELGRSLRTCLQGSREVSAAEIKSLVEGSSNRLSQWGAAMMRRYGYPSQRALFMDLRVCDAWMREGQIVQILPTRHLKPKSWEYLHERNCVTFAASAENEEVGKACRLALSRCE